MMNGLVITCAEKRDYDCGCDDFCGSPFLWLSSFFPFSFFFLGLLVLLVLVVFAVDLESRKSRWDSGLC